MSVAAPVASWHRAHLYKALACVVIALIALQYLLSGAIDGHSIETMFTINASRYTERSFRGHPRGLIIYGITTGVPTYSVETNTNFTKETMQTAVAPEDVSNVSRTETSPTRNTTYNGPNVTDSSVIKQCPLIPPNLAGPLVVNKNPPELSVIEMKLTDVKPGGKGSPENCKPRYKVAIIIPYRDRPQHLQTLLYNLHPMLLKQQIDYQIFIVEQEGNGPFNRAMLMNVGYVEALKEKTFDCFIFHDVDLLPEDDRNLYTCPEQPRHMSVAVDKFKYRLPYADLFGGVSAMSRGQFRLVNGFSNMFWGWGGEDDDMANRIKAKGLHISRYPPNIARYKMLSHRKEKANPRRYEYLKTGKKRFATDGLTNLKYNLIDKKKYKLYTWLLVKLTPPQPS
ncbi:beta-1,4-N-acetylgalactosaminyltransferase bre-4-like [Microplitis mediator]|uniref:beta-1,4-N-acetylgalactosaminyltransferase bre-4 n=1 Tax=Microplitis demolitor TaxID=69319 RepID=UPI0004CD4FD1|nr:beta-1,4-N-acetylgalactosaminyltransferase bre-4 [Microplitis demolitor]XP_053596535.1 beta-1,4-N-acetylgalactosaminyltransferase bre-4 [Microplitis demolitor]XP_057327767.1 beta-1,4-N-acetylgalactosaminyltransferase bre-4-like [Microplitis mediator]XP_057327768.1 beta-1,4-N-acetylgalactosaminyltransferase bre-4-like [Microplitis mediator]